ncbi:MAG: cupin-like domain-containing protein [Thermoanaerobaculia bacterium]
MPEPATVPRVHRPDLVEFRRRYEDGGQPVVITGAMDHWRALGLWSPDYFSQNLGDVPLPVSKCQEDPPEHGPYSAEQLMRSRVVKMVMREYLDDMRAGNRRTYVPGMPLQKHLPMLLPDIDMPEYREEGSTSSPRIWFGSKVIGPLHYDPTSNLHGIVYGGKRFTLFHPNQSSNLYPCSMFSTVPQMSRASLSEPDYARFPRLKKAQPLVVDLRPGDMLFLPAGWWHQVDTPGPTISIDFPWQKNTRNIARPFLRLIPNRVLRTVRGRLGYGT